MENTATSEPKIWQGQRQVETDLITNMFLITGAFMSTTHLFLFATALCASCFLGYTPLFIPVIYVFVSLVTYGIYAKDKSAAENGSWRVSETTLHTLSLLGGWPGARIAQLAIRHKTAKTGFQLAFWITVAVNCAALAWLHTKPGAIFLNTYTFKVEALIINEIRVPTITPA